MNRRMIIHMIGRIMLISSAIFALPFAVALIYGESDWWVFLAIGASETLIGMLLSLVKPINRVIYTKEGFIIVAFSWIVMSVFTAVSFYVAGGFDTFIDCLFESVSGFTTTGATILSGERIEALSHGVLFLRSFTHWIGGMGVLVFVMAMIPADSGRSIHIMRAEMPGPIVGKIVPRIRDTAKYLYRIYIVLTALQVIMLICGGMPVFDSLVYSFGTAGTGGLSLTGGGIADWSPYIQWVIAVFMMIFGINFNLYFLILVRKAGQAFKSTELWIYLAIIAISTAAITLNTYNLYSDTGETIRASFFQTVSIITTTGYTTTNYLAWPMFSRGILFLLMFLGGMAGSTAGGLKLSRFILLCKTVKRDVRKLIYPRASTAVKFEGKTIDDNTLDAVGSYFAAYMLIIAGTFLLLCLDPNMGFEENLTASISCFNNVGPAFGSVASSMGGFTQWAKVILSLAMLLGRLEIYPIIISLAPSTWVRK